MWTKAKYWNLRPTKGFPSATSVVWTGLEDRPEHYLWVSYEVAPVEGGTLLTIKQSNYDEDKAKHSAANWATVIDGLKKLVE